MTNEEASKYLKKLIEPQMTIYELCQKIGVERHTFNYFMRIKSQLNPSEQAPLYVQEFILKHKGK